MTGAIPKRISKKYYYHFIIKIFSHRQVNLFSENSGTPRGKLEKNRKGKPKKIKEGQKKIGGIS